LHLHVDFNFDQSYIAFSIVFQSGFYSIMDFSIFSAQSAAPDVSKAYSADFDRQFSALQAQNMPVTYRHVTRSDGVQEYQPVVGIESVMPVSIQGSPQLGNLYTLNNKKGHPVELFVMNSKNVDLTLSINETGDPALRAFDREFEADQAENIDFTLADIANRIFSNTEAAYFADVNSHIPANDYDPITLEYKMQENSESDHSDDAPVYNMKVEVDNDSSWPVNVYASTDGIIVSPDEESGDQPSPRVDEGNEEAFSQSRYESNREFSDDVPMEGGNLGGGSPAGFTNFFTPGRQEAFSPAHTTSAPTPGQIWMPSPRPE
jgi:hypothetical protein